MNKPVFNQHGYLEELRKSHPEAVILMRDFTSVQAYGKDAKVLEPIFKRILTEKETGVQMYCYSPGIGEWEQIGFGYHNTRIVLPELIRMGIRVAFVDFREEEKKRLQSGKYATFAECIQMARERQEQYEQEQKKKKNVQLTLFDDPNFMI